MTEQAPAPGPLAEANPHSLDELMSRDPLKLLRADRNEIVAELRRMRAIWAAAEANAPSARGKGKAGGPAPEVSAGDLGI